VTLNDCHSLDTLQLQCLQLLFLKWTRKWK